MDEFEFIAKHLTKLAGPEALDLKDDVAIWSPNPKHDAVITMDTIVEGVHFPKGKFDAELARKLIRVNVSDITAKGAQPVGYFMSLSMPTWVGEAELSDFCQGLAQDQKEFDLKLWGGDTTRTLSACSLAVTMIGTVPKGTAVLRSGAKAGDLLCVTGTIGDSYLGLSVLYGQLDDEDYDSENWQRTYHVPNPPFKARHLIAKYAEAALDVSDGLIADAGHLAIASNVGVKIEFEKMPLSPQTQLWLKEQSKRSYRLEELACGGDDYQTLMAISPKSWEGMKRECQDLGISCTRIGTITAGSGVRCLDGDMREISIDVSGYTHF